MRQAILAHFSFLAFFMGPYNREKHYNKVCPTYLCTTYVFNNISGLAYSIVINDPFLECYSRVGYYDVKKILKYEKLKKQNEEEKNRLFFYDSYDLDSGHGKNPILARYKNIKIFFKFNEERKI